MVRGRFDVRLLDACCCWWTGETSSLHAANVLTRRVSVSESWVLTLK